MYLSSQIIRHDNNSYESIFNADKKRAYIIIKSLSYKAKLIFQDSKVLIDDFAQKETRITCRIHINK